MSVSRSNPLSAVLAAGILSATALLAGCGEHHVAPAQEASATAPRPDALAGAPTEEPAPPPPPAAAEPPPPPVAAPPPERPGDKDVVYDLGPVVRAHDTMAPIPNPAERSVARRGHVERVARHGRTSHAPRVVHRTVRAAHARPATAPAARPATPARAPMHRSGAAPHGAPAHTPAVSAKPTAHTATPAVQPHDAVPLATGRAATHTSATKTHGGATKAHGAKTAVSADRGAKLEALQSALKGALARSAMLNVPALKADQPTDVTLTLPADFASVVRDEAGKQGLQDAAASVNMTALLAGDGYAVAPDETQSQPLTVGQPTEFHWTVTAQQGARGPLHADVGADLLGGGDEALQLGSLSPSGRGAGLHISPRAWGAGLLVLLAVIVFAWLSRRRTPAARRRPEEMGRPYVRPLDMTSDSRPLGGDREV